MSSSFTMSVSLVERCWSVAGAVSTVLAALGRAEPRADVLTRASGKLVDRRADLYTIDPHALRCIAEDVEREMEELVAELASRGRPDLDEDMIAEAARMELAARKRPAWSSSCREVVATNRRIGWAALWLRASFCFREDVLQLARTGHPWATSHRPDESELLRRIRTLARRWEQASRRAHEILFGELDDVERAQSVLALGVLVECGYLPPDAVSGYLMAVVVLDQEGQIEP